MNARTGNQLTEQTRSALITGITGQDGSYLAELLLGMGYTVYGITRSAEPELGSAAHLRDSISVFRVRNFEATWMDIVAEVQPDELYHLAADSFVPHGWEQPLENVRSNLSLSVCLLEAIRQFSPHTRMLNACSREVFGNCSSASANEDTPMNPMTPYGINKAASRWTVESYRQRYGVFAANAILFNHESPRRGIRFVTRKITKGVAEIRMGMAEYLELGDLTVRRDWGYAGDFVKAMWCMLQQNEATDYVIGTGITHSLEELVSRAFDCVGLDWRQYVRSVDRLSRTGDSVGIAADISKARSRLGWSPEVAFAELVSMMVEADLRREGHRLSSSKRAA